MTFLFLYLLQGKRITLRASQFTLFGVLCATYAFSFHPVDTNVQSNSTDPGFSNLASNLVVWLNPSEDVSSGSHMGTVILKNQADSVRVKLFVVWRHPRCRLAELDV